MYNLLKKKYSCTEEKMPFLKTRADLQLTEETRKQLQEIGNSRSEPIHRVERARMLLSYADGSSVSAIARHFKTNRPKVERCIDKALQMGAVSSLGDLPRSGKPALITPEARAWVIDLACSSPKKFDYSYELWTTRLLAQHIRKSCTKTGHSCLENLSSGTVSKILRSNAIQPHRIRYYLERRDPDFETKMAQVLYVYREVELIRQSSQDKELMEAVISYDEKPGIQAIGNTAPDLPPVPGKHPCISRDHEYIRYGTVSLMAGINLITGIVHGIVVDRHRSQEFVQFLQLVNDYYPKDFRIRVILDNHSAHISKETRAYLDGIPNRFEFVFTPKHGSWLNLIESFFGKMAKSMLRGIRVESKEELKKRILKYLEEINLDPVIYRWKYKMDTISVV